MISCGDARELINKALDGTLETTERAELDVHAQTCQVCREELRRLELMEEVIGDALSSPTEAVQAKADIMAQLSGRGNSTIRHAGYAHGRWAWTRTAIAAGIMLAAGLALGFVVGRDGRGHASETLKLYEVPMRIGHLKGMVLVRHEGSDSWQPLRERCRRLSW